MSDIVEWLRERVVTWRKLAKHSRAGWIKSANDTADKFEQAAAEIERLRARRCTLADCPRYGPRHPASGESTAPSYARRRGEAMSDHPICQTPRCLSQPIQKGECWLCPKCADSLRTRLEDCTTHRDIEHGTVETLASEVGILRDAIAKERERNSESEKDYKKGIDRQVGSLMELQNHNDTLRREIERLTRKLNETKEKDNR